MEWKKNGNVDLYCDYYNDLYGYINRYLNDSEQSKDLLHDLYFKLQNAPQIGELDNPKAYLNKMAYHLILDYYRQGHKLVNTGEEAFLDNLLCTQKQPETGTINADLLQKIANKLECLAEEKKDILLLNKLQGWNYNAIAKHKKRSSSWVEKSMTQALTLCKKINES